MTESSGRTASGVNLWNYITMPIATSNASHSVVKRFIHCVTFKGKGTLLIVAPTTWKSQWISRNVGTACCRHYKTTWISMTFRIESEFLAQVGSASQVDEVVLHRDIDGAPRAILRFCVPNLLGCRRRFKSAILAVCRAHSRHGAQSWKFKRVLYHRIQSIGISFWGAAGRRYVGSQDRAEGKRHIEVAGNPRQPMALWIQMWNMEFGCFDMLWHALTEAESLVKEVFSILVMWKTYENVKHVNV